MAGLSETGFVPKRLNEVINDQRLKAVEIFKDLLKEEDDFVDTSDVSTIGRMIGLYSVENERVWQQLGFLWASLDPDSATGYSLDVIGKLQGVTRNGQTRSTGMIIAKGTNGVTIPANSQIVSSVTNAEFLTRANIVLVPISAVGVDIEVLTVQDETTYTLSYSISTTATATASYTSGTDATANEVITGLSNVITSSHPQLLVQGIGENSLTIRKSDIYNASDFAVSSNLKISKVSKSGNVASKDFGAIPAEANTLTGISTPVTGWDSVYNPSRVAEGSLRETDADYRFRLSETKSIDSANLIDSLYSNLITLLGVESVTIYENDGDVTDENGLPPHSFMPVVLGGEAQSIADMIWVKHPAGIASNGTSSVTVIDRQGFPQIVRFQRPTPVNIFVTVRLEKDPDTYPINGDEAIVSSIVNWAKEEYNVGKDVIASRLYTPVNEIQGHKIVEILISTTPNPASEEDIDIGYIDIASISSVNIAVEEVI